MKKLGSHFVLAGARADRPAAVALAHVVRRVHHRYATEVVGAYRLCPFLRDAESAFGVFCVVLDAEPVLDTALELVGAAGSQVVHLVYPLVAVGVAAFERFGNELHARIAADDEGAPVHATFHPQMTGDARSAARLVGLLRRAPDPFVQLVPEGLHQGGTTFADPATVDPRALLSRKDHASATFDRIATEIESITALLADIRKDRDTSYAEHLDALR